MNVGKDFTKLYENCMNVVQIVEVCITVVRNGSNVVQDANCMSSVSKVV